MIYQSLATLKLPATETHEQKHVTEKLPRGRTCKLKHLTGLDRMRSRKGFSSQDCVWLTRNTTTLEVLKGKQQY